MRFRRLWLGTWVMSVSSEGWLPWRSARAGTPEDAEADDPVACPSSTPGALSRSLTLAEEPVGSSIWAGCEIGGRGAPGTSMTWEPTTKPSRCWRAADGARSACAMSGEVGAVASEVRSNASVESWSRRNRTHPHLSGPETLAKNSVFESIDRQTLCLKGFGARGACVLERWCSENAVF